MNKGALMLQAESNRDSAVYSPAAKISSVANVINPFVKATSKFGPTVKDKLEGHEHTRSVHNSSHYISPQELHQFFVDHQLHSSKQHGYTNISNRHKYRQHHNHFNRGGNHNGKK